MNEIGQIERATQNRVVKLFQKQLGYIYLGNWDEREGNSNSEEELLRKYLKDKKKYSDTLIEKPLGNLAKQQVIRAKACMASTKKCIRFYVIVFLLKKKQEKKSKLQPCWCSLSKQNYCTQSSKQGDCNSNAL